MQPLPEGEEENGPVHEAAKAMHEASVKQQLSLRTCEYIYECVLQPSDAAGIS